MARPTGWDILGLDGDPTPGVVESVQALAKEFGDFAHDVESAYRSLNSFGSDTTALQWVGQTADAFKSNYGPLPGRLQKLYTSYSEASDALSAYAPKLQAAQSKADSALRQAQDAQVDLQRATTTANNAATDLKTAQQNHAANPSPQAVTDAQTAHDTAQTNLNNAKSRMAALTTQAHQAYDDRIAAAKDCARAIGHAQSDGIHNKHWWEHIGADLAEWGGKIAEIANDIAPVLDVLALATSWIPGVDVITAGLAEADNLVALAGTGMEIAGDAMQGHWGDALMGAGMLGATFLGGKALEKFGGKALEAVSSKFGKNAEEAVGDEARTAEGNAPAVCKDDPIDVVSGQMLTHETDLALPGVLPIILRRAYASGYLTGRLFGPGWASTLDQRLSINETGIHFAGDDAQRLDFPIPTARQEVLPERGVQWPLTWDRATDEIRITDPWTGQTRHFAAAHYQDELGQIRDLTAITDRNGNRVSFLRDESGTPIAVEHAAYRIAIDTIVSAEGSPRVTGLRLLDDTEHGVAIKSYSYDEHGRLARVVNSSGRPFVYECDESDRITAWVDRIGYRYEYLYDSQGRVVQTQGDGGIMSGSFSYDSENRTTVHTSSLGHATTFRYDEFGHLVAETDPLGNTVVSEYDRLGRLLARTDAMGARVSFDRNADGDVTRVTEPDGATTDFDYNTLHQIVATRLPDGAQWRREFDSCGNLQSVVDPVGAMTSFRYSDFGALVETRDPLGALTRFQNDAAGLPTSIQDPISGATGLIRDRFGRVISATDPLGATTESGWTVEGLPAWHKGPSGEQSQWTYDDEGQLVAVTDAVGAATVLEPGPFGRVMAKIGPDGSRHEFEYDAELRLVRVTNPAGAQWRYNYDEAGRLTSETDFIGRTLRYEHDAAGRLAARDNGLGQRIMLQRDAAGQVTVCETPDGTFTYTYDRAGRHTMLTSPESAIEYQRDLAGRVLSETVSGRTTTYEYDLAGRRVRRTTPSGAQSQWEYDPAGHAIALNTGAGGLQFTLDIAGREVERALSDNVWFSRDLDPAGRLAGETLWVGDRAVPGKGTPSNDRRRVLHRNWTWRADGMLLAVHDDTGSSRQFSVDDIGRVTNVAAETWTESYAYDRFGNLAVAETTNDPSDGTIGARQFDRTLIRALGRTTYEHDEAGRLVRTIRRTLDGRRKVWNFTWDSADHLVQADAPDGTTWHYTYDPLGRRIEKRHIGSDGSVAEQVLFSWDGTNLAEQLEPGPAGTVTALSWDYGPGTSRPAAQTRRTWADIAPQHVIDDVFHAIVTDGVGTPTELVDLDGRVAWHAKTTIWGRGISSNRDADVDCPLRFPGQYHDVETGLHYNHHRYYDPATASYLTPDPLGLAAAPNDHAYVPNPLVWIDPLGLKCGTATDARNSPGVATGGENLPAVTGPWLRGSNGNAGRIPGQIADQLRGQSFKNWGDFREAFWKAVGNDSHLSSQFSSQNVTRMTGDGFAPFTAASQAYRGGRTYVLHHATPIWDGGGVYDLDNILVVTPRLHAELLDPAYHYER